MCRRFFMLLSILSFVCVIACVVLVATTAVPIVNAITSFSGFTTVTDINKITDMVDPALVERLGGPTGVVTQFQNLQNLNITSFNYQNNQLVLDGTANGTNGTQSVHMVFGQVAGRWKLIDFQLGAR